MMYIYHLNQHPAMTHKQIDLLNIGLIFFALWLAFKIPFELFLFSYAFFGPLHYLTEINWLNKKNFFIQNPKIIWVLGILAFVVCLSPMLKEINKIELFQNLITPWLSTTVLKYIELWSTNFLFMALATAVAGILTKNIWYLLLVLLGSAGTSFFLMDVPNYIVLIGVFTPTIFHVYVFTGLFILYGAIKDKSLWGFLTFFALLFVLVLIINADVHPKDYTISEYTKNSFISSSFSSVLISIAQFFHIIPPKKPFYMLTENGIKIQIFIAFAYTYHYLNWFSKTSIIKWHNINKQQFTVIGLLWILSVGLYYYDYHVGFIALLFLSMLHVFLEFPLNVVSIKGILQGGK